MDDPPSLTNKRRLSKSSENVFVAEATVTSLTNASSTPTPSAGLEKRDLAFASQDTQAGVLSGNPRRSSKPSSTKQRKTEFKPLGRTSKKS